MLFRSVVVDRCRRDEFMARSVPGEIHALIGAAKFKEEALFGPKARFAVCVLGPRVVGGDEVRTVMVAAERFLVAVRPAVCCR